MRILLKLAVTLFSLNLALSLPFNVQAAMTSDSYQINFDSINVGGTDTASSTSYRVRDSLQAILGSSSSTSYRVDSGYRAGVYDPVVQFKVAAQAVTTQVAATSITETSVVVTTASDFAVGDYIVAVQDDGLDQVSAIGRITSIAGSTLNVDFFQYRSALPVIDGSGDYVYALTATVIPLGVLTPSRAVTGVLAWEVSADVPTGYNVYVRENQDMQTPGGIVLDDVADGAVTIGAEEYGGRSSDAILIGSTFDSQDTAITSALAKVASRANATLLARDFLTLKATASEATVNGAYSQVIVVVFVGNY